MRLSFFSLRPLAVLRRALRDRSAVAAVEFALIAPALIAIPIPVVDIGLGLYTQMEVKEAAQAGAEYALLYAYDSGQIQSAATGATSLSLATVTSQYTCGCPSGNSVVMGGAANSCGTCANGAAAGNYVSVTVTAHYSPPIAIPPAIPSSYTLTSTSMLRVQQ